MTRVELHAASSEDYERLHSEMEREGFSRKIKSDDGRWYQLPTAEYYKISDQTLQQVIDAAKRAASATGRKYSIISSETTQSKWVGLDIVQ